MFSYHALVIAQVDIQVPKDPPRKRRVERLSADILVTDDFPVIVRSAYDHNSDIQYGACERAPDVPLPQKNANARSLAPVASSRRSACPETPKHVFGDPQDMHDRDSKYPQNIPKISQKYPQNIKKNIYI